MLWLFNRTTRYYNDNVLGINGGGPQAQAIFGNNNGVGMHYTFSLTGALEDLRPNGSSTNSFSKVVITDSAYGTDDNGNPLSFLWLAENQLSTDVGYEMLANSAYGQGMLANSSASSNVANSRVNSSSTNWGAINNGLTAFGIGWSVKGAMIDAAAHSGEAVTPALEMYTKVADGVGVAGGVVAMGTSAYNMYNQYEQNHRISDIHVGDAGDFVVGSASVGAAIFLASNPVGWVIGAGAGLYFAGRFVYQVTHKETNQ